MELAHQLQPVRDAGERAERLRDRVVRHAGRAGGCRRGGGVLPVVAAGNEGLRRQLVVGGELDPVDSETARDDLHVGSLEDAELRVTVRVEGAVPVEMVGLEVEEEGDVTRERVDVLELEARELAHDPRAVRRRERGVGERPADVAGNLDGTACGAEDRAEQLGRRRLAVRAGDADEA